MWTSEIASQSPPPADAELARDPKCATAIAKATVNPGPKHARDLKRLKLFEDLSEGDLARIAPLLRSCNVSAGELFFAADISELAVSFVWSGRCRVTILSPDGQHAAIRFIRPGWHFGEISILAEAKQPCYHFLVDESALLLRLAVRDFRELMRSMPGLSNNVVRHLARTAMARANRIYEFSLLDSRLRLQSALLRLAQYGRRIGHLVVIEPAPTHESLATQIGVTREGVTREGVTRHFKWLAQQGLAMSKRCSITILDIKRLEANVAREAGRCTSYLGDSPDWE